MGFPVPGIGDISGGAGGITGGAAESTSTATFGATNIGGLFGTPTGGAASQFVLPAIVLAVVILGVFALRK